MKTLLLLRHGKSSWKDQSVEDIDRPLTGRGKRDALRMGELIREHELVPDVMISSPTRRARSTSSRVAENCGYAAEIVIEPSLYFKGGKAYLNTLRRWKGDPEAALIVGHNPDLEQLVALLSGGPHRFPTAALAWFELPIESWGVLPKRPTATLRGLWLPRELPD